MLSDAGSTPAASTNLRARSQAKLPTVALAKVGLLNELRASVGKPSSFYREEFPTSVDPIATMLPRPERIPGESNSRMAASIAAGLRCMYCCVVARS